MGGAKCGLAVAPLATLVLGIGLNTAIFSIAPTPRCRKKGGAPPMTHREGTEPVRAPRRPHRTSR